MATPRQQGQGLSATAAQRIAESLRHTERQDLARYNGTNPVEWSSQRGEHRHAWPIRVTGAPEAGKPGLWPAVLRYYAGYEGSTNTWADWPSGGECWAVPTPGGPDPASGVLYSAIVVGQAEGRAVMAIVGGGSTLATRNVDGTQIGSTKDLRFDQSTGIKITQGATEADPDIVSLDHAKLDLKTQNLDNTQVGTTTDMRFDQASGVKITQGTGTNPDVVALDRTKIDVKTQNTDDTSVIGNTREIQVDKATGLQFTASGAKNTLTGIPYSYDYDSATGTITRQSGVMNMTTQRAAGLKQFVADPSGIGSGLWSSPIYVGILVGSSQHGPIPDWAAYNLGTYPNNDPFRADLAPYTHVTDQNVISRTIEQKWYLVDRTIWTGLTGDFHSVKGNNYAGSGHTYTPPAINPILNAIFYPHLAQTNLSHICGPLGRISGDLGGVSNNFPEPTSLSVYFSANGSPNHPLKGYGQCAVGVFMGGGGFNPKASYGDDPAAFTGYESGIQFGSPYGLGDQGLGNPGDSGLPSCTLADLYVEGSNETLPPYPGSETLYVRYYLSLPIRGRRNIVLDYSHTFGVTRVTTTPEGDTYLKDFFGIEYSFTTGTFPIVKGGLVVGVTTVPPPPPPPPGPPGTAATITIGSTTTGAPGTSASVTNSGTSSAAVLNFTIPRGDKGDKGDIGLNGAKGDTGLKGDTGAKGDKGDTGLAATVMVNSTTTALAGTSASVTNSGTSSAAKLDFLIPRGADGAAATVAVGTVLTVAAGSAATVTNSGTTSAAVLNFNIPKGDQGDPGPSYLKAWVYFTVSGGVATVRAQNNVSSVTRNAAGNYTITFSTAMLGNLYTATGTADNLSGYGNLTLGFATRTTTSVVLSVTLGNATSTDPSGCSVTIVGA